MNVGAPDKPGRDMLSLLPDEALEREQIALAKLDAIAAENEKLKALLAEK